MMMKVTIKEEEPNRQRLISAPNTRTNSVVKCTGVHEKAEEGETGVNVGSIQGTRMGDADSMPCAKCERTS